jgi:hypothetical protein
VFAVAALVGTDVAVVRGARQDKRPPPDTVPKIFRRCRYEAEALEPATALALRARIEGYAERTRRDRAAVVCTSALRPVLAEFLQRSGIRVSVYAYGELPNEIALATSEVIAEEEPNALAQCT